MSRGEASIAREETEPLSPVRAITTTTTTSARHGQFFARPWVKGLSFLVADVFALVLANIAARSLVEAVLRIPAEVIDPAGYWLFFIPFFATVLYLLNGYGSVDLRRPERELELCFKAVSFSFLGLLAANSLFFKGVVFSRYLIAVWYGLALLSVLGARWLLRSFYSYLWRNGQARRRALIIGTSDRILRYQQLLSLQRHHIYDVVGAISPCDGQNLDAALSGDLPVLGSVEQWEEIVRRWNIETVVLNLPDSEAEHRAVLEVVRRSSDLRVDVEFFADDFNVHDLNHEFDYFMGCFRLSPKPRWSQALQGFCKWGLDRAFGIVGSLITVLLTPFVALLISLEDPGPVFYRREFVGCDGETRYYLKFRTMVRNADQILENDRDLKARFMGNYKLREDPRTLRVGRFLRRFSIDEFPQFFSLFTGQLTLVGPRVMATDEKSRYGHFLAKRLSVTPGITGYWQVMGRQMTTYEERIQMDMFYIDRWSIWLDLFIIAKTFGKMIWPEGAY